jgi:hypothetical protein
MGEPGTKEETRKRMRTIFHQKRGQDRKKSRKQMTPEKLKSRPLTTTLSQKTSN